MQERLYNFECWFDISKQTLKLLENLQLRFYRMLFCVGTGCPIPILYWDSGGLLMEYRILKCKLLFFHHVAMLSEYTLAKEIFETQKKSTSTLFIDRVPKLYDDK